MIQFTSRDFWSYSASLVPDFTSNNCVLLIPIHITCSKQHLKSAELLLCEQAGKCSDKEGMTVHHSFSGTWSLLQYSVKVRSLYPASLPSTACGKTLTMLSDGTSRNGLGLTWTVNKLTALRACMSFQLPFAASVNFPSTYSFFHRNQ